MMESCRDIFRTLPSKIQCSVSTLTAILAELGRRYSKAILERNVNYYIYSLGKRYKICSL